MFLLVNAQTHSRHNILEAFHAGNSQMSFIWNENYSKEWAEDYKNDFEDLLILYLAVFLFDVKVIKLSGTESDQCNLSLRDNSVVKIQPTNAVAHLSNAAYSIVLHDYVHFYTNIQSFKTLQIMESLFLLVYCKKVHSVGIQIIEKKKVLIYKTWLGLVVHVLTVTGQSQVTPR